MEWALEHRDSFQGLPPCDVCITDPPYGAAVHTQGRRVKTRNGGREVIIKPIQYPPLSDGQIHQMGGLIAKATKRWIVVFTQAEQTHLWLEALVAGGARYVRTGCWWITDAQPQITGDRPGVGWLPFVVAYGSKGRMRWSGRSVDKGGNGRAWARYMGPSRDRGGDLGATKLVDGQKPLWLMRDVVADYSEEGELVLDPFAGAGTTLLAAAQLGRRAAGFEVDEGRWALARERLSGVQLRRDPKQLVMY